MTLIYRTPVGLLLHPKAAFAELAEGEPAPVRVFFCHIVWLALLPPTLAFVGASNFGWRLGAAKPLYLDTIQLVHVSLGYFSALLLGLAVTAAAGRWMAPTYGASRAFGSHLALVAIVAAPLAAGSVVHLFPHVFLNLLLLIPALLWSLYLLYTGLPVALGVSPERGMLMASSLVGFLLVGAVTLLGITVVLWSAGIGAPMGI